MGELDHDPDIIDMSTQHEINKYSIMREFAKNYSDSTKSEPLLKARRIWGISPYYTKEY